MFKAPQNKLITIVISIGILFTGCSSVKQDKTMDPALEAYRLIDEQRTNEAIQLLEDSLDKHPDNAEYKVVLASAYAHKAGVRIQTLVPIFSQAGKIKKANAQIKDADLNKSNSERVNDGALAIANLLTQYAGIFEAYTSIPFVNPELAIYLRQAIQLLNSIGPSIKSEDILYRVVLEVVLFKHIVAEGFIGEFLEPKEKNSSTCRVDISRINDTVIKAGKLLIDIYGDIGLVDPKQTENMNQQSRKVSESVSTFTMATTAAIIFDEATNVFLKQAAIQSGFGKIIKCGR